MWVEVKYRTHRPGLLVRQGRQYVISIEYAAGYAGYVSTLALVD